jgi:hypothetical protein
MKNNQEYNSESVDQEIFWNEYQSIDATLQSDLDEIERLLNENDNQIWRRAFCRTFFAYLEGQVYLLKQIFLFYDWWTVDVETEYKIRNQKQTTNKDSTPKIIDVRLPLVQNIKLIFKALATAARIEPIVFDDDEVWKLLARAVNVRNRIVHPKNLEELNISDEEIRLIKYVGGWYLSNAANLLGKRIEKDLKIVEAMNKTADEKWGPLNNSKLNEDE